MGTKIVDLLCSLCKKCAENHESLFSKMPLSGSEFYFFMQLPKRKKYSIQFVIETMNLPQTKISRLITNLVNHDYVCREVGKGDKRMVSVCLTEKGFLMWDFIHEYKCSCEKKIQKLLNKDEQKEFMKFSKILLEGL